MNNKSAWVLAAVGGIVLVLIFVLAGGDSLKKKLDKDGRLSYQTSMTSEYSSRDKADVYQTEMTLDETVNYIKKEIKQPLSQKVVKANEMIRLEYSDEYIIIYVGEDKKTYAQLCSKNYASNHNSYYRSSFSGPIIIFDNHSRPVSPPTYSGTTGSSGMSGTSQRADSIGNRSSQGGGTSFGK